MKVGDFVYMNGGRTIRKVRVMIIKKDRITVSIDKLIFTLYKHQYSTVYSDKLPSVKIFQRFVDDFLINGEEDE